MILFSLVCDNGHDFESWFASNASYDFQIENDLVACPHCNVLKISKAVMAPSVTRGKRKKSAAPATAKDAITDAPKQEVALIGESGAELRKMAQELHARILAATVDVGSEFPSGSAENSRRRRARAGDPWPGLARRGARAARRGRLHPAPADPARRAQLKQRLAFLLGRTK